MPVTIAVDAAAWDASLCRKQGFRLTDADRRLLPSAFGATQICE